MICQLYSSAPSTLRGPALTCSRRVALMPEHSLEQNQAPVQNMHTSTSAACPKCPTKPDAEARQDPPMVALKLDACTNELMIKGRGGGTDAALRRDWKATIPLGSTSICGCLCRSSDCSDIQAP